LKVTGRRKALDERIVLDGIDVDVAPGTILSLLGRNAAQR
jgi:ABC-type uncharacterized transport system ATPase subunit